MIDRLKRVFKQSDRRFMCCVDTNFIVGTILKNIEKETWKIRIKEDVRLITLNESNCILLINDINIYEIKNKLLNDFNTPFERLDEIYNSAINQFVNIITARIGEIKINPALVNWMLKHRLSLNDGLLIHQAFAFAQTPHFSP